MIEVITAVITRDRITVTAIGDKGGVREEYQTDEHGILGCAEGNFEEEPEINSSEELLEELTQLTDQAKNVFLALNTIE